MTTPEEEAKKIFNPKWPEIQKRPEYKSAAEPEWWNKFPVNLECPAISVISPDAVRSAVQQWGCGEKDALGKLIIDLEQGADIGCKGLARSSSVSGNAPSAYQFGFQVTDAVADWIHKKFVYGPVDAADVPANAKINGIMVREKPNGAARVILNLSAPAGFSVNDGIDSDEFPAVMSSTKAWLVVLNRAGRGCWITKCDWSDAYKHIAVKEADTDLQWFEWNGKYFKELCLVFGGGSSAGIYDRGGKVTRDLVVRMASFPKDMTCQHLDDTVAAAAAGDRERLERYDAAFFQLAEQIGVKLAPRDDPDKSFGPCKAGTVFGVHYDTEKWTWAIPEAKLARLLIALRRIIDDAAVTVTDFRSVVGKIINVRPLVPSGRFHVDHIMAVYAEISPRKRGVVIVPAAAKQQLHFWMTILRTVSGVVSIPEPYCSLPASAYQVFTDAAGGSLTPIGKGSGGIAGGWWFYYPWSKAINSGCARVGTKKVSRKLSALELIGPLIVLVAGADWCSNAAVRIWVDNAGSVGIWRKGYCASCPLCSTIVKALAFVAAGIGCNLDLSKVTRCSNFESTVADALSQGRVLQAKQIAADYGLPLRLEPATIPAVLLAWLERPVPDENLGVKLLSGISRRFTVASML